MEQFSASQPDFSLNVLEEVNKSGTFQLWLKPLRSVWSDGMKSIFGAKPSDKAPVGVDYYKLVHKEDIAYSKSHIAICLREGKTTFTHRVLINEEWRYLECHLWKEEAEEACIKGICRDITGQKELEEVCRRLKKSEELWKAALENAEQGVWDWDVEHSTVFFSDMWKRMLGFEPHEITNSFEEWEKRVHPEDLAGAYENIQAHIEGRSELYSYEQRLLKKSGEYMWILGSGKVVDRKADGSPKRFIGTHTDIDHLKQVEAKAKRLALVAEKTQNSVIITGVDGNITWVNNSFEDLTGYKAAEVIGKKPGSFLQGDNTDPRVVEAMKHSIAACKPFDGEIYNYRKDGNGYWLSVSITPIFRDEEHVGFIAIQSDINERKSIESQLRLSEYRLRRAQETAKIGYWHFDVSTKNLEWSDETKRIHKVDLNYEPDVESAIDFYHPESRDVINRAFKVVLNEGKPYDLDLQIVNFLGETVDVRAIGRAEYEGAKIVAVSGIFQDISKNKQYERDLLTAKEKAEAGSRAKQEFLSMMSHEIRTPLNAVIGLTKLLLEENPREDQLENLEAIDGSSRNLNLLINDILDYNRVINGKVEFAETHFSPEKIVRRLCGTIHPAIARKGLEFKLNIEADIPEFVVGDANRLDQILVKLLDNAIKFTRQGYVQLTVSAARQESNCTLHFSVKDSGVGITKADSKRVFEYFTQARSDIARTAEGSGLGLSITSKLIELQGGKLEVESEVGKGSVFQFCIPYRIPKENTKANRKTIENQNNGEESLRGLNVLLAEDNRVNVMVARKFLRKWQIEVDVAANGNIAVEMATKKRYDLILMDLHMPEMGGIEATGRIRRLPDKEHSNIPIIALTASAMLETRKDVAEAGMDDYIPKPFQPDELRRKIAAYTVKKAVK